MELVGWLEHLTCWLRISCSTDWATLAYSVVFYSAQFSGEGKYSIFSPYRQHLFPSISVATFRKKRLQIVFLKVFLQKIFSHFVDFCLFHEKKHCACLLKPLVYALVFRHFLWVFPIVFSGFSLSSIFLHLHNFQNNNSLQWVIHIFHHVFNMCFSLYFQPLFPFFQDIGKSRTIFSSMQKICLLFYIIFLPSSLSPLSYLISSGHCFF